MPGARGVDSCGPVATCSGPIEALLPYADQVIGVCSLQVGCHGAYPALHATRLLRGWCEQARDARLRVQSALQPCPWATSEALHAQGPSKSSSGQKLRCNALEYACVSGHAHTRWQSTCSEDVRIPNGSGGATLGSHSQRHVVWARAGCRCTARCSCAWLQTAVSPAAQPTKPPAGMQITAGFRSRKMHACGLEALRSSAWAGHWRHGIVFRWPMPAGQHALLGQQDSSDMRGSGQAYRDGSCAPLAPWFIDQIPVQGQPLSESGVCTALTWRTSMSAAATGSAAQGCQMTASHIVPVSMQCWNMHQQALRHTATQQRAAVCMCPQTAPDSREALHQRACTLHVAAPHNSKAHDPTQIAACTSQAGVVRTWQPVCRAAQSAPSKDGGIFRVPVHDRGK